MKKNLSKNNNKSLKERNTEKIDKLLMERGLNNPLKQLFPDIFTFLPKITLPER